MKVLIADDHPIVRHGVRQILADHPGIEVVGEARSGQEMVALARKVEWDVAIVDYSMPGRTGAELVKELKTWFPGRPVLILSMYPEELHATRMLKAGAAGYLNKECAADELIRALHKVLNGGRYISAALAEKIAVGLAPGAQKPLHETLSDREYRVMWLLARGKQVNEVADELSVSPSTISTYRARILRKLQLASSAELVRYAVKNQLID